MTEGIKHKIIFILIPLIIGAGSFFVVGNWASSAETYEGYITTLQEEQVDAEELAMGAAAVSIVVAAVPGDSTTPLAEKIADISGYMVIVFVAIFIEKYLLSLTGLLAFKLLIPIACLLFIFRELIKREETRQVLKTFAVKLTALGLILWLLVPASVTVSDTINDVYEAGVISSMTESDDSTSDAVEEESTNTGNWVTDLLHDTEKKASDVKKWGEKKLNAFIEGVAVMIVTTCVIPLAVFLLFIWIIKIATGINIPLPSRHHLHLPRKKKEHIATLGGRNYDNDEIPEDMGMYNNMSMPEETENYWDNEYRK